MAHEGVIAVCRAMTDIQALVRATGGDDKGGGAPGGPDGGMM